MLSHIVCVESDHGPSRGVALVSDELLLEQLRIGVFGVRIRPTLLLGTGRKVGVVEGVLRVVVLDGPLRLDLVLDDGLLTRLLLDVLGARLNLDPLAVLQLGLAGLHGVLHAIGQICVDGVFEAELSIIEDQVDVVDHGLVLG